MDVSAAKKPKKEENGKFPFYSVSLEAALRELGATDKGLSNEVAELRLKDYGPNTLPEKEKENPLFVFLRQFHSSLIYILLGAAAISFLAGHMIDGWVILVVVLFNAIIGFIEEHKAEEAIGALRKLIVYSAKVLRGGEMASIPARNIALGDIFFLEEGDKVPADGRIIESKDLKIEEASLTGESFPVEKSEGVTPPKTPLGDIKNMVWMGTAVAWGTAKVLVTATGKNTALGEVAESLGEVERPKTHFEKRAGGLAFIMAVLAGAGAAATFIIGFWVRELPLFDIFLFSVASLVSGIPEGLPAVLAIVLAAGSWRMAKRKAALRHLPSAETLGVVTVIATDKTGTLTKSSMMVERAVLGGGEEGLPAGRQVNITGDGYRPEGKFFLSAGRHGIDDKEISVSENSDLKKLTEIAAVCNNGKVVVREDRHEAIGDPTEAALSVLGEKAGFTREKIAEEYALLDEIPFNRDNKYRAVLTGKKSKEIFVAGAFEEILEASTHVLVNGRAKKMDKKTKNTILDRSLMMAGEAYRVLALAYKKVPQGKKTISPEDVKGIVWVGAVGMMDPPRPEVREAIQLAHKAGIRVIMKTGDHRSTALAIARQVGLTGEHKVFEDKVSVTETELEAMDEAQFSEAVRSITVFARVTPKMKMRIVEELQNQGEIVAMTGDGVNDAPALKKADIGIAMGKIGTDVAREASEMVLVDDNFSSIVSAVEEGRIIFHNVRQTSFYLVTTNVAEIATILASLLMWLPLPLLPIHVLWLNLVTDGASSLALAVEPGHEGVMRQPPRRSSEPILTWAVLPFGIMMVSLMAGVTIFLFGLYSGAGLDKARTVAFAFMAVSQLFNAFNLRALKKSVFKIGILSNMYLVLAFFVSLAIQAALIHIPYLQNIFRFAPLTLGEWSMIIFLGSFALWLGEAYKYLRSKMVIE